MSELEVRAAVTELAEKNRVFKTCLRGAGSYRHYIPAVVKSITSREELVTAYTPYQAEISQGILQSIFEYQTMLCELTGMDVSNASVYDGATAAAESITMCLERKRTRAYVSATVNPQVIAVMRTYCFGSGTSLTVLPAKDGRTDKAALKAALGDDAACFYLQQPNYFGLLEDAAELGGLVHAAGAKFVMILCNDDEIFKKINSAVFPGTQGGPLMHVIAAKAVCLGEALRPEFKTYQTQIVKNAAALAEELMKQGFRLVSGGTDNHLMLVDVRNFHITGKEMERRLDEVYITVNKNAIPNDPEKPFVTSGIRVGTPAATSRGFKEPEMVQIGRWMGMVARDFEGSAEQVRTEVSALCSQYPIYQ